MANITKILVILGGLIAIVGQWWGANLIYGIGFPLIGGALALIVGLFIK